MFQDEPTDQLIFPFKESHYFQNVSYTNENSTPQPNRQENDNDKITPKKRKREEEENNVGEETTTKLPTVQKKRRKTKKYDTQMRDSLFHFHLDKIPKAEEKEKRFFIHPHYTNSMMPQEEMFLDSVNYYPKQDSVVPLNGFFVDVDQPVYYEPQLNLEQNLNSIPNQFAYELEKQRNKKYDESIISRSMNNEETKEEPEFVAQDMDIPIFEEGNLLSSRTQPKMLIESIQIRPKAPTQKKKRKRKNFPKDVRNEFQNWLKENSDSPYPTSEKKKFWEKKFNLTKKQIDTWFSNGRQRYLKTTQNKNGENQGKNKEKTKIPNVQTVHLIPSYCNQHFDNRKIYFF